jgi:hypothetical protein
MREDFIWPTIVLVSASSLAIFSTLPSGLIDGFLSFWFLLFCVGMTWVQFFKLPGLVAQVTLALALSLGIDSLVAVVMLYGKFWNPGAALSLMVWISIGVSLLKLLQSYYAHR